jgi:transcriptional regulator with XRE-family HTH domain
MGTIGERIKRARGASGLSQQALAQRANVSMNGIARLEQDSIRDPHLSQLQKISAALGVSVGELVGEPVPLAEAPTGTGQPRLGPAFYEQGERALRYLRLLQLFATDMNEAWAAKVRRNEFDAKEFEHAAATLLTLDSAYSGGVGTDLLAALLNHELTLPEAEREAFDRAKGSIDAWHRTMWRAYDTLRERGAENVVPLERYRAGLEAWDRGTRAVGE